MRYFWIFLLTFIHQMLFAEQKAINDKTLSFPLENASVETLTPSIIGILKIENKLIFSTENKDFDFVILTPANMNEDSRQKRFGVITDSARKKLKNQAYFPVQGFFSVNNKVYALNGSELIVSETTFPEFALLSQRSIVWDTLLPASDSRGEPSAFETNALRSKFKQNLDKTQGVKFSGVTQVPTTWWNSPEGIRFFLISMIKEFPLLSMICKKDEPTQCYIERSCFIEDPQKTITAEGLTGIVALEKERKILIGDKINKKMHVIKFDSCFHSTKETEVFFPKKMKQLGSIYNEDNIRFWASSLQPDDYNNASVYFWSIDELTSIMKN